MKLNLYLCAFASNDLTRSVERLYKQAQSLKIYRKIRIYRPSDLSDSIKKRIQIIIKKKGSYLYGHEIWKQYIINDFYNTLPNNSIIHYCDIGCHLNNLGKKRLFQYISLTKNYDFLTFDYSKPPKEIRKFNYKFQINKEYNYTKGDVFKYFKIKKKSQIYNSPQIWAGSFFLKKSIKAKRILNIWGKACKNIRLLDNSPSKVANHKEFIGMRGSQGVFSIICKKMNVKKISASECEWAEDKDGSGRKWDHLKNYPILAKRDLKYGLFKRFLNRQKKTINRIKNKLRRI